MKGTSMVGYWSPNCPVLTSDPQVLATVFKKKGTAMIAIASWAPHDTTVKLKIDWKALGIDAAKAKLAAPAIDKFQDAATYSPGEEIPISKNKGVILVLK